MHATLRADAHVAAGRVWLPGPASNAPMNPLKVTMPPALAGGALAGAAAEPGLRGRRSECEALDRLVADLRAGQSQVLILRGEAGTGKTALLEYLLERASGYCVARAAGVESERELAFAGCISCAHLSWTGSSACPVRSATPCPRRLTCRTGTRRIASRWAWPC